MHAQEAESNMGENAAEEASARGIETRVQRLGGKLSISYKKVAPVILRPGITV